MLALKVQTGQLMASIILRECQLRNVLHSSIIVIYFAVIKPIKCVAFVTIVEVSMVMRVIQLKVFGSVPVVAYKCESKRAMLILNCRRLQLFYCLAIKFPRFA